MQNVELEKDICLLSNNMTSVLNRRFGVLRGIRIGPLRAQKWSFAIRHQQ